LDAVNFNTIQKLARALKDMHRLEDIHKKRKNEEAPVKAIVKAVVVSVSAGAKLKILNETLK
jgi:hypothetical protein